MSKDFICLFKFEHEIDIFKRPFISIKSFLRNMKQKNRAKKKIIPTVIILFLVQLDCRNKRYHCFRDRSNRTVQHLCISVNSFSLKKNNLPNEILVVIFRKLSNVMLLYSLSGVDIRLNKILHDSIFTSRLGLFFVSPIRSLNLDSSPSYSVHPLPCSILDQYCSEILPAIHENVTWLNLESSSMERILLATNYPGLYGIGLYNISIENVSRLFSGKRIRSFH